MLLASWRRQLPSALVGSKAVPAQLPQCRGQPQQRMSTAVSCNFTCSSSSFASVRAECPSSRQRIRRSSSNSSSTCQPRLAAALQQSQLHRGTITAAAAADQAPVVVGVDAPPAQAGPEGAAGLTETPLAVIVTRVAPLKGVAPMHLLATASQTAARTAAEAGARAGVGAGAGAAKMAATGRAAGAAGA